VLVTPRWAIALAPRFTLHSSCPAFPSFFQRVAGRDTRVSYYSVRSTTRQQEGVLPPSAHRCRFISPRLPPSPMRAFPLPSSSGAKGDQVTDLPDSFTLVAALRGTRSDACNLSLRLLFTFPNGASSLPSGLCREKIRLCFLVIKGCPSAACEPSAALVSCPSFPHFFFPLSSVALPAPPGVIPGFCVGHYSIVLVNKKNVFALLRSTSHLSFFPFSAEVFSFFPFRFLQGCEIALPDMPRTWAKCGPDFFISDTPSRSSPPHSVRPPTMIRRTCPSSCP